MLTRIKTTIATNKLSDTTKVAMWELYRHYYHYDKGYFMKRIESNNYYSFYSVEGKLVGFTGLRINRACIGGRKQLLIYFGQTVIDSAYRGKFLIPGTAAKLCLRFWNDLLSSDLYFWADALTYKAYLVFAKSVPEIYPSWKQQTPAAVKAVIDHLGYTYYGENYCAESGTVRKDEVMVNDTTLHIPLKYRQDDDIRFYTHANPQYIDGHGLLTIVHMNKRNLRALFLRYISKILGWKRSPVRQNISWEEKKRSKVSLRL